MMILRLTMLLLTVCISVQAQEKLPEKAKCELCNLMSGRMHGVDSIIEMQVVRMEGCILKQRNYNNKGKQVWGTNVGLKGMDTSYVRFEPIDAGNNNFQAVVLFTNLRFTDFGKVTEFWTDSAYHHMLSLGTNLDCSKDSVQVKKANAEIKNMIAFCDRKTTAEATSNVKSKERGIKITFQDPSKKMTSMKDVIVVLDGDTIALDETKKELLLSDIKRGDHVLTVYSKWWKPVKRTVTIEKGKLLEVLVKFQAIVTELPYTGTYYNY